MSRSYVSAPLQALSTPLIRNIRTQQPYRGGTVWKPCPSQPCQYFRYNHWRLYTPVALRFAEIGCERGWTGLRDLIYRKRLIRPVHTTASGSRWQPGIGSEPGIDPSTYQSDSSRLKSPPQFDTEIHVIDYCGDRIENHEIKAIDLESFLQEQPKPAWASCRWIYVNGLHWDVVRALGKSKNLHPLAIEDVLDVSVATKVDWYESHCFLELNMVKLVDFDHHPEFQNAHHPYGAPLRDRIGTRQRPRWRTLSPGKFGMSVEQVSAFLTSDNTVITLFEHSGNDVLSPIMTRLQSPQTVIRSSDDPSMLLQAVIDAVVDLSLPIGRHVGEAFDELEAAVLTAPAIGQSKQLHVLRSGLTLLMENSIAISSLVRTLCDHSAGPTSPRRPPGSGIDEGAVLSSKTVQISPLAQLYLQDVQDHVTALSNSTHMSIRSAENLTSLIFNTIAASQNESVRQLTLVSCFFLPLTFLTGYFGMNFDPMPVVNEHSDAFFWLIAGPVMTGTLFLLAVRSRWYTSMRWTRARRSLKPPPSGQEK